MKKYFLTGMILLLPLALTIIIVVFLVDLFTDPFVEVVSDFLTPIAPIPILNSSEFLHFFARIIILISLTFFLILLGFLARRFFFKSLIQWMHSLMSRIPMVRSIYSVSKDLLGAIFTDKGKKAFTRTLLVPFPSKKSYCAAFQSGSVPSVCQEKVKKELVSVFVPTAPHPISGYLVLIEKDAIVETTMTKEEVLKFTVSCGVICPERKKEPV